ncbi:MULTISPECIES: hypothetical protein [Cyanophyceae]|uniref:hypothetical protein n=1 Tax=Cyanophyceae TaxID=3028117 RepID=UPI001687D92B|nr:hypothetical protein [Trichocoleus sp. FACHB-40]MBD2003941.1 hypothetical protein [Trichocoleus sp. FACHB-40]
MPETTTLFLGLDYGIWKKHFAKVCIFTDAIAYPQASVHRNQLFSSKRSHARQISLGNCTH